MLLLIGTTDKLQLTTSSAEAIDVNASYIDFTNADPPVTLGSSSGRQNTAIVSATTTDIVATPASTVRRNVKTLHIRNKGTNVNTVTVVLDVSGTDYQLHSVTLRAGEMLEYIEGVGFFVIPVAARLRVERRVTADYINATTSFTDITGLTCPVEAGKFYNFLAHLFHREDAATTGAQFGVNGPAMTLMHLQELGVVIPSVTAATMQSSAGVTALDTAAVVATASATTPANHLAILSGYINPSASGTFAIRGKSEVAVAAGLTVRAGSFLMLWEAEN